MAFTENPDHFLNTDEFAETMTVSVGGATMPVIFDRPYEQQLEVEGEAVQALASYDAATAAGVTSDSEVVIVGKTYRVTAVEPEGTHLFLKLILQYVSG